MIALNHERLRNHIISVRDILITELNIKDIEFIDSDADILIKKIRPNFKSLGPRFGKKMKFISNQISQFSSDDIKEIETSGAFIINQEITIRLSDVEIISDDIPGWEVVSQDGITVALDIDISNALREEGLSREFVNRIQNIRKEKNFSVTDKIEILVEKNADVENAIANNLSYICSETLSNSLIFVDNLGNKKNSIDLIDGMIVNIEIKRI